MEISDIKTNLDLTYFIELGDGDIDFLKDMILIFKEDALSMLKEMENAIIGNNIEVLKKIAHKYKSVVKVFGLEGCYLFVTEIEANTLKPGSENFQNRFACFSDSIKNTITACDQILLQIA